MPIAQLERQRGADARRRHFALGSRMRNVGVWLTVVCSNIEWFAMLGLAGLEEMLEPSAGELGPDDYRSFWEQLTTWGLKQAIFYVAAVSLVEPFYVTAGFALYLNRRAILEGWDIELALRRLEQRLRTSVAAIAAVLVLAVGMSCALCNPQAAFALEAAGKSPSDEIRQVLKSPDLSQQKELTRWHYIGPSSDNAARRDVGAFWLQLSLLLGQASALILWVAGLLLVAAAVYYLLRLVPEPRLRGGPGYRPPDALFGFDLVPESLPADVAGAARELARDGRLREALSLLYRGALSALVHRYHLQLSPGDTEGDCTLAVRRTLPVSEDYFSRLVDAWQALAYAARLADASGIERLCDEWPPHFAPPATP
jgi:hypothetical protein